MTTFIVWKYDDPDTAARAAKVLKQAAEEGLVRLDDHAVVSWALDATKPQVKHSHAGDHSTGWGAFWGLLMGSLFLVPVLGVAAGAALGKMSKATEAVGIDKADMEKIQAEVRPGTSALFAVTDAADLDRLGERFHGLTGELIATNLTPAERTLLRHTFGAEASQAPDGVQR